LWQRQPVVGRVNTAPQESLSAVGIEIPFPTQNLNLQVQPEAVDRLSQS
jgi:small-conductance mechanosensitive channel